MPTTSQTGSNSQQFLESVLPGISGLTSTATGNIANLLNGLPSASQARTTNAYWGVGAGTPAGGAGNTGDINSFIGQRGTDLYGQQAQANRQTGLQDLLSMVSGFSSPALQNQGQQLQNTQFQENLGQNQYEFNQNNILNQLQAMLSTLNSV